MNKEPKLIFDFEINTILNNLPPKVNNKLLEFIENFPASKDLPSKKFSKMVASAEPNIYKFTVDRCYRGILKRLENGDFHFLDVAHRNAVYQKWEKKFANLQDREVIEQSDILKVQEAEAEKLSIQQKIISIKPASKEEPMFKGISEETFAHFRISPELAIRLYQIHSDDQFEIVKAYVEPEVIPFLLHLKNGVSEEAVCKAYTVCSDSEALAILDFEALMPEEKSIIVQYLIEHPEKAILPHIQQFIGDCYKAGDAIGENPQAAFLWYELASEQGFKSACYKLGQCYWEGFGTDKDAFKGANCFEAVAADISEAAVALGVCYLEGEGRDKNLPYAIELFSKAAAMGHEKAFDYLCRVYLVEGQLDMAAEYFEKGSQDSELAMLIGDEYLRNQQVDGYSKLGLKWYRKAAQTNSTAQYFLGNLYDKGIMVERNVSEAIRWFEMAEDDDSDVNYKLGMLYLDNPSPIQALSNKAQKYFQKAYDEGDMRAAVQLGILAIHEIDYKNGTQLLKKAAEQGEPLAMLHLGHYHFHHGAFKEAVEWYEKAASVGLKLAQKQLSTLYFGGFGVEKNRETARNYFELAMLTDEIEEVKSKAEAYAYGEGAVYDIAAAYGYFQQAANLGDLDSWRLIGDMQATGQGTDKNFVSAIYSYEKAAAGGNSRAANSLAYLYATGTGTEPNMESAVYWYSQAAKQGDWDNQNALGKTYDQFMEEYFQEATDEEKFQWYLVAAEKGNVSAMYKAGFCYQGGTGTARNDKQAYFWLNKAAARGHIEAINCLGVCYYEGKGTGKNIKKALELFTKAANENYGPAYVNLGNSYFDGVGVKQDYQQAVEYYEKGAKTQEVEAYRRLFQIFENGIKGVPKDLKRAATWLKAAAVAGDATSQFEYSNYLQQVSDQMDGVVHWLEKAGDQSYLEAQKRLVAIYSQSPTYNRDKSRYWLEKAAELEDVDSQLQLAGDYVPSDMEQAARWYKKAARNGNPEAQKIMGDWYFEGNVFTQNTLKAVYWYEKAAEFGNRSLQRKLGDWYFKGENLEKDIPQALHWYAICAKQGDMEAQRILAYCYFNGEGVEKDVRAGIERYTMAANQGMNWAMQMLAYCYYFGVGVKANPKLGAQWCDKLIQQSLKFNMGKVTLTFDLKPDTLE